MVATPDTSPEIQTSPNIERTHAIAEDLARAVLERATPRALVIALEGELGAGKTAFTQGFARALGIKQTLTSPTFVIMKQYPIPPHAGNVTHVRPNAHSQYTQLVHIDAYRLTSHSDLIALGIETLLADPHNIIMIEWPERVAEIMPADHITIHLDHLSEFQRKISIIQ